jgi:glycerol-3-phosphate dehydrogenase
LSVFTGIRPLVKAADSQNTAALSRDHTIEIDRSGLLTITGGKWTTYRRMAEDAINRAAIQAKLPEKPGNTTRLNIHGYHQQVEKFGDLAVYGSDALAIQNLIRTDSSLGERLHPDLPYCGAEVIWAVRREMARTVEDVLARRTRALFLNARAAVEMAPLVANLMATELGYNGTWPAEQIKAFTEVAHPYLASS